jgi:hypothetical protein
MRPRTKRVQRQDTRQHEGRFRGIFAGRRETDGQRFLVNRMDGPEAPLLNIVVNWRRAFGIAPGFR